MKADLSNIYAPPSDSAFENLEPDAIYVRLNATFILIAVPFVILTAGLFLLALAWIAPKYPRLIDSDGVTTRGGVRVAWAAFTKLDQHGGCINLFFDQQKVVVPEHVLHNGSKIRSAILARAGHLR